MLFTHPLTTIYFGYNHIGATRTQFLADGLRGNMIILILFFPISHIRFLLFYTDNHRIIPSWKDQNILLKLWGIIRWRWLSVHFFSCTQTLTKMYVGTNEIGHREAQYLSDVLVHNTVVFIFSSFSSFIWSSSQGHSSYWIFLVIKSTHEEDNISLMHYTRILKETKSRSFRRNSTNMAVESNIYLKTSK